MKLCYYQLLDFRQGVRENLMKGQGVRVHIKVKNHWPNGKSAPGRLCVFVLDGLRVCCKKIQIKNIQ